MLIARAISQNQLRLNKNTPLNEGCLQSQLDSLPLHFFEMVFIFDRCVFDGEPTYFFVGSSYFSGDPASVGAGLRFAEYAGLFCYWCTHE